MNMWIKRGLQTALLTGGFLAVGTGIAAADDGSTTVIVDTDAVLSAPAGDPVEAPAHPDSRPIADVESPVTITGNSVAVLGSGTASGPVPDEGTRSDGSVVDADAPVQVCGNGVAVLGTSSGTCGAEAPAGRKDGEALVDADVPVEVCGNAIGALGRAGAWCSGPADTSINGSGSGSAGSVSTGSGSVGSDGFGSGSVGSDGFGSGSVGSDGGGHPQALNLSSGVGAAAGLLGAEPVGLPGRLAYTGSESALPVLIGAVVALMGLGLILAARRRSQVWRREEDGDVFVTPLALRARFRG